MNRIQESIISELLIDPPGDITIVKHFQVVHMQLDFTAQFGTLGGHAVGIENTVQEHYPITRCGVLAGRQTK